MLRSLLSFVLALTVVTASFAQPDEARALRTAEDAVVASVTTIGNAPRVSGSAFIDETHVQVDLFFVNVNEMIVPNSAERFLFDVTTGKVSSLGAPTGEIAVLPIRDLVTRVQSDALSRFEKVHPSMVGIPDGCCAQIKATEREAAGNVVVTCESFGGIAGMWMGDAIEYTYTEQGRFLKASR